MRWFFVFCPQLMVIIYRMVHLWGWARFSLQKENLFIFFISFILGISGSFFFFLIFQRVPFYLHSFSFLWGFTNYILTVFLFLNFFTFLDFLSHLLVCSVQESFATCHLIGWLSLGCVFPMSATQTTLATSATKDLWSRGGKEKTSSLFDCRGPKFLCRRIKFLRCKWAAFLVFFFPTLRKFYSIG